MLVITGATGQLGRQVIDALLGLRVPAQQIIATTRDPQRATTLADQGVAVRAADFAQPTGLAAAFAGAGQVLVVSPDKLGEEGRQLSRAAIEAFLAQAGLPFTALRHGYYAESALHHLGRSLETGELRLPEDGPVSWTTRADLAEADARILADEGRFDGLTPPLTALAAFTFADLAAIASELTGREIKHVPLTDTQWTNEKRAQGVPEPFIAIMLGTYRAMRRGDFAATGPALAQLLGRPPHTMHDVLAGLLKPAGA